MHILDVGQGDSILLETPDNHHILVDAGISSSGVAQTLERLGVEELDLVFSTHPHADHIGGMRSVLEKFEVEQYLDSGLTHSTQTYKKLMGSLEALDVQHRAVKAGEVFKFEDDIQIRVIWPGARLSGTRSDLNSNSVVLRITHGEDCMLLTGDSEEPTEDMLLRHKIESCEVLKVAHHGSRHSTSMEFLQAVQPEIAIISAGRNNRYGHPHNDALKRLENSKTQIYRTDQTGHITVLSTGSGLSVVDGLPTDAPLSPRTPPEAAPATDSEVPMEEETSVGGPQAAPEPPKQGWLRRLLHRLTSR
ncbi:MAG: ComEC/Rec2 family competence protein [Myxococcota bacterium]|nr:ComEC/Rec2 family competence protein [Myxococcota bacterium]